MDWIQFLSQSSNERLGAFRVWLMEQAETPVLQHENTPVWMYLIENRAWECINELTFENPNRLALNEKNAQGQGWLHMCVSFDMPDVLAMWGLGKLNATWWEADCKNQTPFHLLPSPMLAHRMSLKWWAEQKPVAQLLEYGNPKIIAEQAGRWDLVRLWAFSLKS